MWTCPKCKESIDDQFDSCWKCGTRRDGTGSVQTPPPTSPAAVSSGGGAGAAFAKGGCGCLVVFVALGFLVALAGGRVHADVGGLIFLFVIGGIIGLIVLAIYNKGRKDANASGQSKGGPHEN